MPSLAASQLSKVSLNLLYFCIAFDLKLFFIIFAPPVRDEPRDPCVPNPCGSNAICSGDGQCTCLSDYQGDPYVACKPECVLSTECPHNRACVRQHCIDPCPGTCGTNAICEVHNHIAMCHCPERMTGNAFVQCIPMQSKFLPHSLSLSIPLKRWNLP